MADVEVGHPFTRPQLEVFLAGLLMQGVIETSTGRRYLVMAARKSPTKRQRWNLDVLVMSSDQINPIGTTTHMLRWYSRERKVGR